MHKVIQYRLEALNFEKNFEKIDLLDYFLEPSVSCSGTTTTTHTTITNTITNKSQPLSDMATSQSNYSLLNDVGGRLAAERMHRENREKRKREPSEVIDLVDSESDNNEQELFDLTNKEEAVKKSVSQNQPPAQRTKENNYEPVVMATVAPWRINAVHLKLKKIYKAGKIPQVFVTLDRLVTEDTGKSLTEWLDLKILPLRKLTRFLIRFNWVKI